MTNDNTTPAPSTSSEFARSLSAKLTADVPPEILTWGERVIDQELQEVREVLRFFMRSRDCWCVSLWKGQHEPRCDRARALYAQLQPKESE